MEIKFKEDYLIEVTYDYSPMRKNVISKTNIEELEGRELDQVISEKSKGLSFGRRIHLTKKERMVNKTREYKKLFSKGDSFKSIKGVNILVGDNGCGKSTFVKLLIDNNIEIINDMKIIHVDMEKSNPTITKPNPEKGVTYSAPEIIRQFMWSAESHGETREGVLLGIFSLDFDILILDEPEQGLSLKNQKKYLNKLKEIGKDIIIITHSKIFVENTEQIFDIESMKWISSEIYLKSIE